MTSIKKRGKHLLSEIQKSAMQLVLLSEDLSLLTEIHQLASRTQACVETLNRQLAGLKKAEFSATLAHSESLAILEELVDNDAISQLEERFFAAKPEQDTGEVAVFLQQLLAKIENHYASLLESIQQLTALSDEE